MKAMLTAILLVVGGVMVMPQSVARGQGAPVLPGPGTAPPAVLPAGPVDATPEVRAILRMLEERKATLKDFTGKIDYSVENGRTGDVSGKRGTVDFVNDPVKGPGFTADFTVNTEEGKPKLLTRTVFVFDGVDFVIRDHGVNNANKKYIKRRMLPDGAKPGDAATLNGGVTLPIGLNVEDVIRTFEVTSIPGKEPDQVVLKIVPREKAKYEYSLLEVTVDKRAEMQVPIKLAQTANNGDITRLELTELKINNGQAKKPDTTIPDGWTPLDPGTEI